MSNEMKDWMVDKIEDEKQIVAEYPFLRLRNINGTIDTESKFPMMLLEIPDGWYKLFFQMCEDIKPILEKEGVLESFYFIQVKEKYNNLICYSNGVASQEVEDVIEKYEHMAYFVCTECGKPATCVSTGYWASFCDDCWKDHVRHQDAEWVKFKPFYKVSGYKNGKSYEKTISYESEWNRYLKENHFN